MSIIGLAVLKATKNAVIRVYKGEGNAAVPCCVCRAACAVLRVPCCNLDKFNPVSANAR